MFVSVRVFRIVLKSGETDSYQTYSFTLSVKPSATAEEASAALDAFDNFGFEF
jgi:hypothetical protein